MSLGDFTHRNGEMAFIFIAFHKSGRAVVELANTLRNEHGGKIAIADFLNSGIKDRMLGSQGSASRHRQPCGTVGLTQSRDVAQTVILTHSKHILPLLFASTILEETYALFALGIT
jgi:hypothetical protein